MRPAVAHIRLEAFRHNYRIAKQRHGGKALAVIKANAYGHGAVACAQAIATEADGFAVAAIEEALQLRQAGITNPILLLEGFFEAAELPVIAANNLWIVVHHQWQVDMLLASQLPQPLQVWLKMDSGMHRVGLSPAQYAHSYRRMSQHKNVEKLVLMSHFANADNLQSGHTLQQIATFQGTLRDIDFPPAAVEISLANSAAILGWPQAQGHWSRPGIMLYGASPIPMSDTGQSHFGASQSLRPVMQLTSRIISTRTIAKSEAIGYGSLFTAERDTLVGVVACGYADGYPRSATGASAINAPAAVDGKMTTLIGRVSMDMLFVDLTDIPSADIGSQVELWGNEVSANDVATAAGTIAYELFCNVKRVHFQYSDNV